MLTQSMFLPARGLLAYVVLSSCSHGCADPNLDPHDYTALLSPMDPSPHSPSQGLLISELVMGYTVGPGPCCLSEGHVFCEVPAWGGTGSLGIEVILRVLGRWQSPG